MGKPFSKELDQLESTLEWASGLVLNDLNSLIENFSNPVYIVGSGGSLSACYLAANLLAEKGIFAKAVTPLELFYSKPTLGKANVIFISASGRNNDILFAFKKAIEEEPVSVITICTQNETKLTHLAKSYSGCYSYEFELPSGKDGFLATNSLLAFFVILYRAITAKELSSNYITEINGLSDFINAFNIDTTLTILYGGYTQAVAVDIESKCSEAGLLPTLISDFRHFAHGRHQWFDKKKNSAIIALTTSADEKLAKKTIELLPSNIPVLYVHSTLNAFEASLELLIQSMYLVKALGIKCKIDPGRPGVPDYGSKIYHLRYEKLVQGTTPDSLEKVAINRKIKPLSYDSIANKERTYWKGALNTFLKKMQSTKFGALILDYDGTICSATDRWSGLSADTASYLLQFLQKGFVLGIVSGRGKSLRTDLNKLFNDTNSHLRSNVLVGYYNGSDVAPLTSDDHPSKLNPLHPSLLKIKDHLAALSITGDESPNQLTFGANSTRMWHALKTTLINEMMLLNLPDITMVESSHSIDIIPREVASKNNIIQYCIDRCKQLQLPEQYVCIGDKGQWPGNDFMLLANPYSFSVGEVSSNPYTGWNVGPAGMNSTKGFAYLYEKIIVHENYFTFNGL